MFDHRVDAGGGGVGEEDRGGGEDALGAGFPDGRAFSLRKMVSIYTSFVHAGAEKWNGEIAYVVIHVCSAMEVDPRIICPL